MSAVDYERLLAASRAGCSCERYPTSLLCEYHAGYRDALDIVQEAAEAEPDDLPDGWEWKRDTGGRDNLVGSLHTIIHDDVPVAHLILHDDTPFADELADNLCRDAARIGTGQ